MYSADQRCPRCQYPVASGAASCPNCGLAFSAPAQTPYGNTPLPPPPPPTSPYGGTGYGGYDFTNQSAPAYPGSAPGYGGSASAYPGSQPPGGFGAPPTYPGSQPQRSFGAPAYPGAPSFTPSAPPARKRGSGLKIAIIVLVILVVLGGGGGVAAYFLTRPRPTINVTSTYHNGSTPVGATSTVFNVTGQKFSGNSPITFLLDGKPAPDTQTALSDNNGNLRKDLTVSANWGVGPHTLTARDASDYTTQTGVAIVIVNQGQNNTPGPNSAPTDSGSFSVTLTVSPQDASTGQALNPFKQELMVQGQAQTGQQICDTNPHLDDGQPHSYSGTDRNGTKYTETYVWKCAGTYKSGKLSYTETSVSDVVAYANGIKCTAHTPYVWTQLDGTFTSATELSGTYSADIIEYTCKNGTTLHTDPEKGTMTGTLIGS